MGNYVVGVENFDNVRRVLPPDNININYINDVLNQNEQVSKKTGSYASFNSDNEQFSTSSNVITKKSNLYSSSKKTGSYASFNNDIETFSISSNVMSNKSNSLSSSKKTGSYASFLSVPEY